MSHALERRKTLLPQQLPRILQPLSKRPIAPGPHGRNLSFAPADRLQATFYGVVAVFLCACAGTGLILALPLQ